MATLLLSYANPNLAKTTLANNYQPTSRHVEMQRLMDLMGAIGSGAAQGSGGTLSATVVENATAATGTMTATGSASNNVTVTVGSVTFTGKTGTPSGSTQFKVGVSATADGAAFAAAVNAHTTTNQYVSALNASGVVTLTAIGLAVGVLGNALILSSSDATNMAVVAFASGANDSGAKTYNF